MSYLFALDCQAEVEGQKAKTEYWRRLARELYEENQYLQDQIEKLKKEVNKAHEQCLRDDS